MHDKKKQRRIRIYSVSPTPTMLFCNQLDNEILQQNRCETNLNTKETTSHFHGKSDNRDAKKCGGQASR